MLSNGIRPCDELAVMSASGWDAVRLWPCVIGILPLAVVAIVVATRCLCVEWRETAVVLRKATIGILSMEAIFGSTCLVFCAILAHGGRFSDAGGLNSCSFMGWFTGFYLFAWPVVVSLLCLLTQELMAIRKPCGTVQATDTEQQLVHATPCTQDGLAGGVIGVRRKA